MLSHLSSSHIVMARYLLFLLMSLYLFKDVASGEACNNIIAPIETYWHSTLPNTSMPNAIRNLIHPVREGKFVANEWLSGRWHAKEVSNDILSIFFHQKDLYQGAKIKEGINFERRIVGNAFIPRAESEKIPFSSEKLPQILNRFSIVPGSTGAIQIEKSVHECEAPASIGVKQFCATSLEAMIDNVISELGTRDVKVMATTLLGDRGAQGDHKKVYKVASSVKKLTQEKIVLCHPQPSPQAVFNCHMSPAFKGYLVFLEANDGTKVNAVAACHYDTENFTPVYFKRLEIKPGTEPLCHFLPEDNLLWAPRM